MATAILDVGRRGIANKEKFTDFLGRIKKRLSSSGGLAGVKVGLRLSLVLVALELMSFIPVILGCVTGGSSSRG